MNNYLLRAQVNLTRSCATDFGRYSFYDCGDYGLFTLTDERFQPSYYGKRVHSPASFFRERSSRYLNIERIRLWKELGPCLSAIGNGGTVLDVGGYIGTFSIPLALATAATGMEITFHAFEPGPTRDILSINIEVNQLNDRVHVYDAGISSFDGHSIYRFCSGGSIGGALFGNPTDGCLERIVPVFTIDRICSDIPGRLFIKLDTQGHEAEIMGSSLKTIAEKRVIWQIEFMAWVGRKDFGGRPFCEFLIQEFHVFEGAREIMPSTMPAFLEEIDLRPFRMADLILVPKGAQFTVKLLEELRSLHGISG